MTGHEKGPHSVSIPSEITEVKICFHLDVLYWLESDSQMILRNGMATLDQSTVRPSEKTKGDLCFLNHTDYLRLKRKNWCL